MGMLSEARKACPSIDYVLMDMRSLGFNHECFDGIWANGCIYHVPKSQVCDVMFEVRRVLKPKGIISFNFKVGEGEQLETNPRSYGGKPRFYAYYGIDEIGTILTKVDFEVLEIQQYPQEVFEERIAQMWAVKP